MQAALRGFILRRTSTTRRRPVAACCGYRDDVRCRVRRAQQGVRREAVRKRRRGVRGRSLKHDFVRWSVTCSFRTESFSWNCKKPGAHTSGICSGNSWEDNWSASTTRPAGVCLPEGSPFWVRSGTPGIGMLAVGVRMPGKGKRLCQRYRRRAKDQGPWMDEEPIFGSLRTPPKPAQFQRAEVEARLSGSA